MGLCALTFDDGPDPVWTPRLLDLLDALDVPATFFPIASRAAAQPELIARIRGGGHTIGLHCHEHIRHSDRDEAWLRHDTLTALNELAEVGVTPELWRTPWGDTAPWTEAVAAEHGLALVDWTVDTHDWRGDTAQEMFSATAAEIVGGAIVLMHDGIGPGSLRAAAAETVGYTDAVVSAARARGLSPVALTAQALVALSARTLPQPEEAVR
jgi:peptidoglycan-N-acetylglucosamine deacetylase